MHVRGLSVCKAMQPVSETTVAVFGAGSLFTGYDCRKRKALTGGALLFRNAF